MCIALALTVAACDADPVQKDAKPAEACGSGFELCADEGLIRAKVLVKTCTSHGDCQVGPSDRQPYLGFVQVDGPPDERCGPGDCGAVPHALQQGWNPGRWKVVAPPLKGLRPPPPITIDLEAGERLPLKIVYRDTCILPTTIRKGRYVLKGSCPRSEPLRVGESRRMTIGMVHKSPCWGPPDFAGSFWRTDTHLAPKAMAALHGGVTGRMELVGRKRALFRGPAIRSRETPDGPVERVPAKGRFVLAFHRIPGGIRTAGCA